MTNSKKTSYKLTKKDFRKLNLRSLLGFEMGWNYETMQGSGYLYCMLPILRKIYGDGTPELKSMMKTHSQFFNTSNYFNNTIFGIDLALEEKYGYESKGTVEGLKVGLMGSFAAIGDSVFASLFPTILGALAASMASQGNPTGVFIWILVNCLFMVFRWKQTEFAYKRGTTLIDDMQGTMSKITDSAIVLGIFMVGALVASMVNIKIGWTPQIGKVPLNIQNDLDMITPKLLPALLVGFVYWLLGKKGMNTNKAIIIVLVLSIILGGLGVVAKI